MIMLISCGKLTSKIQIDEADEHLIADKMIKIMQCGGGKRYAFLRTGIKDKKLLLHRFLLDCPDHLEVDHINGDSLDNRRNNLRICSHKENQRNQIVPKRDLPRGVFRKKDKKLFLAQITVDLKTKFLGYFKCPAQASASYHLARKKYFGNFYVAPMGSKKEHV